MSMNNSKDLLTHCYETVGKDDQFIQQVLDCNDTKQFVDYIGELVDDYEVVRTENSATSIVGASPKIRGRVQRFIRYSFHLP